MGFLDALTGRRKIKDPAPDRLFALTTAAVTLESALQITTTGSAGIVFQPLATADFETIVKDMQELVGATSADTGTTITAQDDAFGYRWMVLKDPDVDDLVVGVNAVSESLIGGGYGDRLLCAVFAFHDAVKNAEVHFIYNFKRGSWYPFVPAPGAQQRSTERELQLKAQIGTDLPIEPELERWFPLWGIPL